MVSGWGIMLNCCMVFRWDSTFNGGNPVYRKQAPTHTLARMYTYKSSCECNKIGTTLTNIQLNLPDADFWLVIWPIFFEPMTLKHWPYTLAPLTYKLKSILFLILLTLFRACAMTLHVWALIFIFFINQSLQFLFTDILFILGYNLNISDLIP
jgi:hypothetical protein